MTKSSLLLASAMIFSGISIANAATATFGTHTDISGTVTVEAGSVDVSIDLSKVNITRDIPNGYECFNGGLKYHIHALWTHNSSNDYYSNGCNSTYTGGHYDPWVACSSSTGNNYCATKGTPVSCVPGSSAWKGGTLGYSCDSTNYTENPYVCEVGDWSGKYGVLTIDNDTLLGSSSSESAYEVDGTDLTGLSVVFHCNDDTRAFCAPFEDTSSDTSSDRATQSTATSQQAKFTQLNNSTILLENDNTYSITFDLTDLNISSDCGSTLYYRIYNAWETASIVNSTNNTYVINTPTNAPTSPPSPQGPPAESIRRRLLQEPPVQNTSVLSSNTTTSPINPITMNTTSANPAMNTTSNVPGVPTTSPTSSPTFEPTSAPTEAAVNCSAIVGKFYDPTVSCAHDTENTQYCEGSSNDYLCNDTRYSYNCSVESDPYSCAPGDLSGKYGVIDLTQGSITYTFDGTDELMISLELLAGKSAVLQCSETNEILACAEFKDYSSSSSGGSSSSSSGSASTWWVWVIVGVGAVLLIGGGVWLYRAKCAGGDGYSRVN